jgi:beta-1,4-N-acetylglucosaminyltransferase
MIFVTVGTTDFDALVRGMDDLAPCLGDEVVCQIGVGAYVPRNCAWYRFAPSLDADLRRARLVVSHGGLGTIMEVLRLGKPLVGVSNPDRPDLHQDDLLRTLAGRDHLLWCRRLEDLEESIEQARATRFVPYSEPPCHIHTVIQEFMNTDGTGRARVLRGALKRAGL